MDGAPASELASEPGQPCAIAVAENGQGSHHVRGDSEKSGARQRRWKIAPTSKMASILGAAKRTFFANGFTAASMDAIAREAGASKATVYAYFVSKEELFRAVVVREIDRCAQTFSAGELDPDDIEVSLNVIADRFLRLVSSADVIAINRIIIGEVARSPALADVFWQAGPERIRIQVETFLHRAAKAGTLDIADARLATNSSHRWCAAKFCCVTSSDWAASPTPPRFRPRRRKRWRRFSRRSEPRRSPRIGQSLRAPAITALTGVRTRGRGPKRIPPMTPDLTDDDKAALIELLTEAIERDSFPRWSPRNKRLRAILAKLDPPAPRPEPLPAPKPPGAPSLVLALGKKRRR